MRSLRATASYILTGEVDAGFINLTSALSHKDKLGGYMLIDEKLYSPIVITVGRLNACDNQACTAFLEYIQSPAARTVFDNYGL